MFAARCLCFAMSSRDEARTRREGVGYYVTSSTAIMYVLDLLMFVFFCRHARERRNHKI